MNIKLLKKNLSKNLLNMPGINLGKSKFIVIESDDWGSIRMPSTKVYESLVRQGIPIKNDVYNKFDNLASEADLSHLFEVLRKFKDKNGNYPFLTTNLITANPVFEKIEEYNFEHYFYEPFDETIRRQRGESTLERWSEGIKEQLLAPQYHGRDHVHVQRWLQALKGGDRFTLAAFREGVFGIALPGDSPEYFMAALDYTSNEGNNYLEESLKEGLDYFQKFFGFTPLSFIAPCYIWDRKVEKIISEKGIKYLQGKVFQLVPQGIKDKKRQYKRRVHWTGQKNAIGQTFIVRNVFFEPASNPDFDWISDALKRIEIAFRWGKPAVISSHRVNYIGANVEKNRIRNLSLLEKLLKRALDIWPNIIFTSTDRLGLSISNNSN